MLLPPAIDISPYEFACDAEVLGIPHFWNVITNLPFLAVGIWGIAFLVRRRLLQDADFRNWAGVWFATALLCFGSGAYHWFLNQAGLAADRICICGLMAFVAAHALHVTLGWGPNRGISLALLIVMVATVFAWLLGATAWLYGAAQIVGGLGVLALFLWARSRGRLTSPLKPLLLFLICYAVAKGIEAADIPVCEVLGFMGGHPLKHLLAALGLWMLGGMMVAEAQARET